MAEGHIHMCCARVELKLIGNHVLTHWCEKCSCCTSRKCPQKFIYVYPATTARDGGGKKKPTAAAVSGSSKSKKAKTRK